VVQVEGKTKLIQHLEGGIVSHINVANGDWVNEGDQLLLLDAARDRAEKQILIGRLFNTQATVERLEAERDDRDKIEFSRSLKESAGTDQRAVSAMASEDALFNARFADREGEEAVINSQRAGLEAMAGSTRSILKSLDLEIEDLAALLSDGYVDKQKLRELERARARTLGELADLEVSVDEANLRVVQLRKKFKTQVVHELTEAREELHDLEQQYLAASDRAERATVRAPVAGVVLNLKLSTIGEVIGSGETLMEIVPQVDQLVVDARVTPMDIDRVQVGQSAEVRFAVFKDAYLITGTLTKLSADSLTDEATGETYYAAEIKLLEEDLYLFNNTILVPGMPAEVLIKTGERTMLGYLTSPLNRLFARSLIED
jgi:epimerase transport system membrane fusion protein